MSSLSVVYFIALVFTLSANVIGDILIVPTKNGNISGVSDQSSKGREFYAFHNIPFAEPPIGKLRFKDPQTSQSWEGVRDGTTQHAGCASPDLLIYLKNKSTIFEGQEDCLYLSVYTPEVDTSNRLPVLLYIHGGAFMSLAGGMYTGYELMNENVVYVTIDYRLGVLGFLSTEDDVMPGNLGLKDQTMAMKWVQENIMYFGGDPSRVTIFGVSAGGASVHYHILSPASKGLFNRAIIQSGTALGPWTHSEGLKYIAHQVGAAVGCYTPAYLGKLQSERLHACLQNIDAEKLTMIFNKFMVWNFLPNNFVPYVDGEYIPDQPEILLRKGKFSDVDIMIGVTKDEGAWLTESVYSDTEQIEQLQEEFDYYGAISLGLNYENSSVSLAKKVFNKYLGKFSVSELNADQVIEMYGDAHFKVGSDIVALMHSEKENSSGNKVYSYQLDYKGQRSLVDMYQLKIGKHWIAHGDDGYFLFPKLKTGKFPKRTEDDARMRDLFTKLWANFAATGNPTPDSNLGFKWEPFTSESPMHLSLKLNPEMKRDERNEIRQFWASLSTRQNMWLYGSKEETNSVRSEL